MTIETATPSNTETLAALFDRLVDQVVERVLAEMSAQLPIQMDAWALNSMVLEDKTNEFIDSFVTNQLDLDDTVRQALDNIDLDDMVMSAVQELEFSVRVSR